MSESGDTGLRAKLVETIAPMLADGRTGNRVGRATRKKAEAIADAVIARIYGEGYRDGVADRCCARPATQRHEIEVATRLGAAR